MREELAAVSHNVPMTLPLELPVSPMLAKAIARLPGPDEPMAYEPKWDGFRAVVARDGDDVHLDGRSGKSLVRYFPELVELVRERLPDGTVLDGEVIVRSARGQGEHLDWEALSARIHPAASRVAELSTATPAEFVAFDVLAADGQDLTGEPFEHRRARLEALMDGSVTAPEDAAGGPALHLSAQTRDRAVAADWFSRFEGAGLDGVMVKPLHEPYAPGKRATFKLKHKRTAEAVVLGYRVHKSGTGVGSLLLGLLRPASGAAQASESGPQFHHVGGIVSFPTTRRRELIDELEPWVIRDEDGNVERAERERTRFSSGKDRSFVPMRPERVVEVAFDQLEGDRFRHAVTFVRWRDDVDPSSCTLEQIDRAPAYDLRKVFAD